jgi:ribosome-binding factor A
VSKKYQHRISKLLRTRLTTLLREKGRGLRIRNIPRLAFHYDPSLEYGEHISSIIDRLGLGDEEAADTGAG